MSAMKALTPDEIVVHVRDAQGITTLDQKWTKVRELLDISEQRGLIDPYLLLVLRLCLPLEYREVADGG